MSNQKIEKMGLHKLEIDCVAGGLLSGILKRGQGDPDDPRNLVQGLLEGCSEDSSQIRSFRECPYLRIDTGKV